MTADMEFKGKNVKKAVELAAETLGISAEDIDYKIVSHGSTGIFGLAGVKKARIIVRAADAPELPEDQTGHLEKSEKEISSEDDAKMASDEMEAHAEDAEKVGQALLRRLVDAISPESTISVEKGDQRLRFLIEGGQSGILIGKRGQTLEAIQLIVEKAVRRINSHNLRLQVDVEGYLAKKKAGLVNTAQRLARKVASKGSPSSVGFLNAQDRRVVHLALKNHKDVRTKSVGEGPIRKLMIYPKRKPRTKY